MRRRFVLAMFFLAAQAGWADLTVRFQTMVTFGPGVPSSLVDVAKRQMGAMMPSELIQRVKGNRCSTSGVAVGTITGNGRGEVTLLNAATKQFTTLSFADYSADIAKPMPEQPIPEAARQMLQSLKFDVHLKKNGPDQSNWGIRAEESLIKLSMDMPAPGDEDRDS
jgi:hypothetical protein